MNVFPHEIGEDVMRCPYCDSDADVCSASLTNIKLDAVLRSRRCSNESYYNCALFLAKGLRSRR